MARKKTVKSETTDLAQPQNRTEEFLAKIAGLVDTLPQGEFSRLERYLKYIAENGGGGGGVTSFNTRTGAVVPQSGDYTPEQVGAAPAVEDTTYAGCYKRTVGSATEWINPPMIADTEYRTTERYLGKPVYVKCVTLNVPTAVNVIMPTNTGIPNVDHIVSSDIRIAGTYNNANAVQYIVPFTDTSGNSINGGTTIFDGGLIVYLYYTGALTFSSGKAILKYTKTTD